METYNQFKTRVTDGKNLVEVDPVDLRQKLTTEPSGYVDRLKAEHKAAIMAKHKRVTKKPIVTSEITQGEVSALPDLVESTAEPLASSADTIEAKEAEQVPLDVMRENNRTKELVLKEKRLVLIEMAFAWVMGVFSGYGIYLVTRDIWSFASKFFVKLFIK